MSTATKHSFRFAVCLSIIAGTALTLRLPALDSRPMHGDEAVHALKFDTLWTTGRYVYDPNEYHGPTLYYFTLPAMWLSGARSLAQTTEITFRIVPVAFGIGLILLLTLVADGLGRAATIFAAALTAISPAMVFYSRYYIQETLLAFFTLAVIATAWRYLCSRRVVWAVLCGIALGLMHATKETSVVALGCMAAALPLTTIKSRRPANSTTPRASFFTPKTAAAAVLAALATATLFYSGFLTNPHGPLDALRAMTTYFGRAGAGGIHEHPWDYYLHILLFTRLGHGPVWTEGSIVALAAIGAIATLRRCAPLPRFFVIYAALLALVYSLIPYKTPWCLIQFLQPMILVAGVGAAALFGGSSASTSADFRNDLATGKPAWKLLRRVGVGLLLLTGAAHLGWQAGRASFRFCADYRNPYVYSQPLLDVVRLSTWVDRLARVHPDGDRMLIKVVAPDPWPLPWYLRRFDRVGYWDSPPPDADAPVVICSSEVSAALDARLHKEYQISRYGLRPDVTLLVYVDRELYAAFAASAR